MNADTPTVPNYCTAVPDSTDQYTCMNSTFDIGFYTFFGWMGVSLALTLANMGTAYGTAKSGMGIASMSVTRPHLAFKSLVPIIMAGILSIYGLIISVLLSQRVKVGDKTDFNKGAAFKQMGAGLACGISCIGSGYAIGLVGEYAVRFFGMNEAIFVAIILIMIFAEVIGLYGMIVAIIMSV